MEGALYKDWPHFHFHFNSNVSLGCPGSRDPPTFASPEAGTADVCYHRTWFTAWPVISRLDTYTSG